MMEENEEMKEAIKELKYLFYTMPIKPPIECDDKDKWKDNNKKLRTALEYAIIRLQEKVPCKDAVSREAVKELFQEGSVMGMYYFLGIDELPSVTPKKDGWIPVSEKLPQSNEYEGNVCKYYLVQDKYDDMYVARYAERGWNPIDTLFFLNEVVAWMPLPLPWKAESEETE